MTSNKVTFAAIIKLLQHVCATDRTIPSDSREGLEVCIQCLETAFNITEAEVAAAPRVHLVSVGNPQYEIVHHNGPQTTEQNKICAEALKTSGNEHMQKGEYLEALDKYSLAIDLDSQNAVFFCNRAAAYTKLNNHARAIEDCETALRLDPSYTKAYGRMGLAYTCLQDHSQARECYRRALELEPENESYLANMRLSEEKLEENPPPIRVMPDFGVLLNNPTLMNMATQLMSDPSMQNMMTNIMSRNMGTGDVGVDALLEAGQHLAQYMRDANPEFVTNVLGQQMRNVGSTGQSPEHSSNTKDNSNQPADSDKNK